MTILGIDPGTRRIGYGVIRREGSQLRFVAAGLLTVENTNNLGAIRDAKSQLDALIKKFKPGLIAIERLFFSKNRKTGIEVAQARGVMLLGATEAGVPVKEYTPSQVKSILTGYGFADKKSVLKMVRITLSEPDLDVIDDASDALAVAISGARNER
ncbi:crossover junction endodeoxyribonuclease RuvC [Candidatus Parcubacteria bacterium]|nr:MAG: crossover junction endodeoxyribonuclease RuvC [Candidatus Parcubacteria bacterium]